MRKKTQKEFITEAVKIHGIKYDYSLVEYKNSSTKVKIICPIHGVFEQKPVKHVNAKQGCNQCAIIKVSNNQRKTKEEFISEAINIHGDKYDYSLVEYKSLGTKVKLICPIHGEFEQTPGNHLSGKGCRYCGGTTKMDTKLFIIKAKEVHGDKYDYYKVDYELSRKPIKITCPIHGEFEQIPNNHISKKQGCPECVGRIINTQMFIEKSKQIHGNKYDYSLVDYKSTFDEVKIICPIHGIINVRPHYHLNCYGCKNCSNSLSLNEKKIVDFIREMGIECIENDRSLLKEYELDIYIPSHNIAIEYNGLYWHSEEYKNNDYHLIKTNKCEEMGVQLIHIYEDDWLLKENIVKSRIKNILKLNEYKIYARKCVIKVVNKRDKKKFLDTNHIQGSVGSKIDLGLYYKDELVSIMTFGKRPILNSSEYELIRFCNKLNISVVGAASKLFTHFIKNYNPSNIISYADRSWSQGLLYENLGFEFVKNTTPNWFVVNKGKKENRIKYQKHKLIEMGGDINKTATEIMLEMGLSRIFDSGQKVYVYKTN
jgi:hypothetical protein